MRPCNINVLAHFSFNKIYIFFKVIGTSRENLSTVITLTDSQSQSAPQLFLTKYTGLYQIYIKYV